MAKDPAMLWYWNDWNSGTVLYSRFLKGCYMDLLHAQFNHGHLSLDEIKSCLGSDFGQSWTTLQKKFKQDENGLFFNEKLESEKQKRMAFSESRRANLSKKAHMEPHIDHHMDTTMAHHMEDINENIDTKIKTKSYKVLTEQEFGLQIAEFKNSYSKELLREFFDHWREKTPSGKMLFQLKPSWELSLRLSRWKKNQEVFGIKKKPEESSGDSMAYLKKIG